MRIKTNCSIDAGVGASSAWYLTKAFRDLGHELVTGYEADLVVEVDGMPHVGRLEGAKYFFWDTDSFIHDPLPDAGQTYDQIFIAGAPEDLSRYPEGTVYLPHAFDPEIHKPYEVEKEFDIVMIGRKDATYVERNNIVEELKRHFTVFHEEVPPGEEYARAMSRGKLIFNKTLGKKNIPMRFFEGMAIGALVENYNDNLDGFASEHTHYIPYRERDLLIQIEYYLNHEAQRLELIKQAQDHALKNHTYKHRALEMLKYV